MTEPAADEPLAELFWSVARRLRRLSHETLAPWDINPSHARALSVLARHGGMRLSALAQHLHIAPRSATEVVDALEERGLALRHRDPADRRATRVELSAEGSRLGDAIKTARAAEAQAVFGSLTHDDQAQLARILRTLSD